MENGSVSERIAQMVEHFNKGNKSAFAKAVGISNQSLGEIVGARQSAPSFAALQKMLTAFPEVRMEWLIMGKGEMLPPTGWVDPFAGAGEEGAALETRQFLPPVVNRELEEQRWEDYQKREEQRMAVGAAVKALVAQAAKNDDSGQWDKIAESLEFVLAPNLSPQQEDALWDEEHEKRMDEYRAQGGH